MLSKISEFKEWIGYGLAIVFLILSVVLYFTFTDKIDDLQVNYSNEAITSAIEASNNSKSIYEFSKYQLEEEIIDANGYSSAIGKLVLTHEKLIQLVKGKSETETNNEILQASLQLLETRKQAYVNLKTAVDMGAENFNIVADNKFVESDQLANQILSAISENK